MKPRPHMRPTVLLLALLVSFATVAGGVDPQERTANLTFVENKGQFRDMGHQPVPFVLFRAETPTMKVWVTEQGLTYVFTEVEKESKKGERDVVALLEQQKGKGTSSFDRLLNKKVHVSMAWASMRLSGAHIDRKNLVLEQQSREHFNYFMRKGSDAVMDVHAYNKVTVRDVYPGIDWVLYGGGAHGFKYDFLVHPGADASLIQLVFDSDSPVRLQDDGGLKITTALGSLQEGAPMSYTLDDRQPIANTFVADPIDAHHVSVHFTLAAIDPSRARIIDPQITWSTLMSCDMLDGPYSITTNSNGDVITTGYDGTGTGFPLGVGTGTYSGAYVVGGGVGFTSCYLRAFNSSGVLQWSTLYEGAFFAQVITDANNRIICVGSADSSFSSQPGIGSFSGAYFSGAPASAETNDMCIVAFASGGAREWATFAGASLARTVCTDASGNIILAGHSVAADLPVQAGIGPFAGAFYQAAPSGSQDLVMAAFSPSGTKLWATYFGGTGEDGAGHITRRSDGKLFICGFSKSGNLPVQAVGGMTSAYQDASYGGLGDGALIGLAANGALEWCTYFGGTGEDNFNGVVCDQQNRILVTGLTQSTNFPLMTGTGSFVGAYQRNVTGEIVQDAFVGGFSSTGVQLWASYVGGSNLEGNGPFFNITSTSMEQIGVDNCGHITIVFNTASQDMPITSPGCSSTVDPVLDNNFQWEDVFLMRFTSNGALNYSTYIGGGGMEFRPPFTIDPISNALYVTGETYDQESFGGFPFVDAGGGAYYDITPALPISDDAFITKFTPTTCDACNALMLGVQAIALDCNGDCDGTAIVSATQGTAPYTYAWSNGLTTATGTGLCAGTYTVDVIDANGLTATLTFEVQEPLPVTYGTTSTASLCTGNTGTASVATVGAGVVVLWSDGQTQNTATGLAPGDYTVTVTDLTGCSVTDTVTVSGISTPIASALVTPNPITAGESTQLVGLGGMSYVWSPATGLSCTTCANPTASPSDTTTYCVTVFDSNNCSDTACVRVDVLAPCSVYVPNAFSPNASGRNDTQCVYGACITFMVFSIYDRWGNKVFETFDQKTCWDGLHNGEPVNPGVFVYHLSATLNTGETVEKQGNITLVR